MKKLIFALAIALCSCASPMVMNTKLAITYADGSQKVKEYNIHGLPNLDDFKPFKVQKGNIVFGSWYGWHTLERDVKEFKVVSLRVDPVN